MKSAHHAIQADPGVNHARTRGGGGGGGGGGGNSTWPKNKGQNSTMLNWKKGSQYSTSHP